MLLFPSNVYYHDFMQTFTLIHKQSITSRLFDIAYLNWTALSISNSNLLPKQYTDRTKPYAISHQLTRAPDRAHGLLLFVFVVFNLFLLSRINARKPRGNERRFYFAARKKLYSTFCVHYFRWFLFPHTHQQPASLTGNAWMRGNDDDIMSGITFQVCMRNRKRTREHHVVRLWVCEGFEKGIIPASLAGAAIPQYRPITFTKSGCVRLGIPLYLRISPVFTEQLILTAMVMNES